MATKVRQQAFSGKIIIVICLLAVSLITTVALYYKFNKLNTFLKGVNEVRIVRSYSNDKIQKLVVYSDSERVKLLLTNNTLDPRNAKEIFLQGMPELTELREQSVPFYKKKYFILPYGGVEGSSDYLVFDEDGNVITRALVSDNTSEPQFPKRNIFDSSIVNLSDDGIIIIMISGTIPPGKTQQYNVKFDITTGKFKSVSPQL